VFEGAVAEWLIWSVLVTRNNRALQMESIAYVMRVLKAARNQFQMDIRPQLQRQL
jgi:hypothetical protein